METTDTVNPYPQSERPTPEQCADALNRTGRLLEAADACMPIGYTFENVFGSSMRVTRAVTREEFEAWYRLSGWPLEWIQQLPAEYCHFYEVVTD